MRKSPPAPAVLLALLLAASPAFAGPAGRSYSSGGFGSSGGKSASFGGGKSASFGGGKSSSSPAGRSYSSGGKTAAPAAGRTSPAAPAGGNKLSPSPPPAKTSPLPAPGPGRSRALDNPAPVRGRTYSSGAPGRVSPGSKPPAGGYDVAAGSAQRRQESKEVYTKATQPKPTYTDGKGQVRPIDPTDVRVAQVRRLDAERWASRQQRQQVYFAPYVTQPVVVYHDPYNSLFWWWLLAQGQDQQALWAYHHQADMDQARYQNLLARDRALEAKVRDLEARKVPRDPTYVPPGLDPDLAYTDAYVNAAYNPQPSPAPAPPPSPPPPHHGMVLLTIVLVLLLLGAVVWLLFFKRWKVS